MKEVLAKEGIKNKRRKVYPSFKRGKMICQSC